MTGSGHKSVTDRAKPASLLAWPNIRRQNHLAQNSVGSTGLLFNGPSVALGIGMQSNGNETLFAHIRLRLEPTTW